VKIRIASLRCRGTLLILTAVPSLGGCGHSQQTPSSAQRDDHAPIVLVRGIGPGPDSLDLEKAQSVEAQTILRDLFECLTSLDHDAQPAPGAAQSWTVSPDGKTYTFTLRPNARWSNGDRVTAADFVAGLRRLVDPATASPYGHYIELVRNAREILLHDRPLESLGVTASDEAHVTIELIHPAPYFPALLSHPSTCPLHRPTWEKYGSGFAHAGTMVSNGAFVLSEWVPGERVSTVRNRFYWADKANHLDGVMWLQISDENAEYLRYRAEQLDVTASVPVAQLDNIRARIPSELQSSAGFGTDYYGFNLSRPPFRDNPKLRRALMLAIDRETLVKKVLPSGALPAYGWVPPGTGQYQTQSMLNDTTTSADRVREAQRLFAEAGYSGTHPLHFRLEYNSAKIHTALAVAISSMWRDTLGVTVDLVGVDFATLINNIQAQQVEMFRSSWIGDYNDPQSFLEIFGSDSGENMPHYRSTEYDALLTGAEEQPTAQAHLAMLEHAERVLLRDAPVIPLYFHVTAHLVKPRVNGWYQSPMNVVYSKDLSLKDGAH
jgi:oligopeptide transport system substrate-binding protein